MAKAELMQKHLAYTLGEYYSKLSEGQREKFSIYYEELLSASKYMNLTTILSEKDVANKHFADSVYPDIAGLFENEDRVVDIGSGAGFPGIPLKIVRPDLNVTMIEATGKKAEFIKNVSSKCGLDVSVVSKRAEDIAIEKEYREKYDVCVSRAVARLDILLELCAGFVKTNGYIFAYKGDKAAEEKRIAESAAVTLGLEYINTHHIIEEDFERCILVYKKIKPLSDEYPRRYANIKKKPL
jgi:16S rRNA (guanine527-N7)-methyltransferase